MSSIGLYIDIAVVVFIWIVAIGGYKKGLVKTLYSILSFVGAAIVTAYLYKPLCNMLLKLDFVKNFNDKITQNVTDKIYSSATDTANAMPSWMGEYVNKFVADTGNTISQGILQVLVSVLSVIIVYLLVKLALGLFIGIVDFIMKLPVLDIVNKAGGLLFGVIKGVIIVLLVFAVLSLFLPNSNYKHIHTILLNTNITKYFYNNNILMKLIMR